VVGGGPLGKEEEEEIPGEESVEGMNIGDRFFSSSSLLFLKSSPFFHLKESSFKFIYLDVRWRLVGGEGWFST